MNQASSKIIAKWIRQNFTGLFPVENTNDKNENNSPQSYKRWMHSLMNTCSQSVSQSVFCQVLNAVSGVF